MVCAQAPPRLTRQCASTPLLQLLLLGFGDVRNVLATAAECAAQRSSQCRELAFDLCDNGLANVARGTLLLRLVGAGWALGAGWTDWSVPECCARHVAPSLPVWSGV